MKLGNRIRRICMVMLCLMMIFIVSGFAAMPSALAEGVTVTIQSFMRGVSADGTIRNAELMEAVLTGYEGNPYELTYEWTNVNSNLDLYIYNSYNMTGIDDTDGEIEKIKKDNKASGKGFAWASVRSKKDSGSVSSSDYNGKIQVTVKDARGNVLATDTYEKFLAPNLQSDMEGIAFGMFIGETVNVKDLLGRSAIVHVTCGAASVSNGSIDNSNIATLKKDGDDYKVTGKTRGETEATITVTKTQCSFHTNQKATVTTPVYVFEKPNTSTTTTTLTLTNLDDRCEYFIGSMQGIKDKDGDKVIFTGLTPNTKYQVTVRGKFEDTNGTVKYAFAYVEDTTKPVYPATVNTYLDNILTDLDEIHGGVTAFYVKAEGSDEYIRLENTSVGVHTAGVDNGTYHVYHFENNEYHLANNVPLVINAHGAELNLNHYSVTYYCGGGSFVQGEDPGKQIYLAGSEVSVTNKVPVREGYSFVGWTCNHGKTYQPGDTISMFISEPFVLTAQWEKTVSVTINVTIDHQASNGGYDDRDNKADLEVTLLEKRTSDDAFGWTGDTLYFTPAKVTNEKNGTMAYTYTATYGDDQGLKNALTSTYTATAPTYVNRSGSSEFSVRVQKSDYSLLNVTRTKDSNGDWTIDIKLVFQPTNFDLQFSVQMADGVPKELWPDAVIYKLAFYIIDVENDGKISKYESQGKARYQVKVDMPN